MNKKIEKILYKINILICIFALLLSFFNGIFGQTLGFHNIETFDRYGGGPYTTEIPDAGDVIEIPSDIVQCTDDYEGYERSWMGTQKKIYDIWASKGKTHSEDHWAYIEVAGTPRYLVAVAPIYGVTGDYIDIYISNSEGNKVYPCIIGDEKDIWYDTPYVYQGDGKKYGHVGGNNSCKIIEVCTELLANPQNTPLMVPLLNKMKNVTKIVNGGNMFENPDGPVGLDGTYTSSSSSSSSSSGTTDSVKDDEELETTSGVLQKFFRDAWDTISVSFENEVNDENNMSVLYDFKNMKTSDGGSSSISGGGSGDILKACEEVTRSVLNRGLFTYSTNGSDLISGDIKRQFYEGEHFCCGTYVSCVLYYSGLLTEEHINKYSYHFTGAGGIPDMLEDAGWRLVPESEVQPGDVVNNFGEHVMIYAGDGKVWDQTSMVISSNGTPPTGTTKPHSISGCQIWRAP